MRRFHFVRRRTGVMASVSSRNLNAQRPVVSWIVSGGLTPSVFVTAACARSAWGTRQTKNTRTFAARFTTEGPPAFATPSADAPVLVPLPEIHAGVHARDLIAVAVEHQGLRGLEVRAQPALCRLTPARMIDFGIHVRIEPVFPGILVVPRGVGHLVDEPDPDDR